MVKELSYLEECIYNAMNSQFEKLLGLVKNQSLQEGINHTLVPSLNIFKSSNTTGKLHTVYEPSLFVIVQGAKIVIINDKKIMYDSSSYLISSTFMPVSGKIIEAPFLSLQITFTFEQIFEAIEQFSIKPQKITETKLAMSSYEMTDNLLNCVYRLVSLLNTPEDAKDLSSLYLKEILYRLLISNNNIELKQFAYAKGNAYKISNAIAYMNDKLFDNLQIDEIAEYINMSVSSFHKHFKIITSVSPIQYIKKQKLQKAKSLMLSENMDVSGASYYVGYQSVSQFSREYSSYFGVSPSIDIKNFKEQWSGTF